MRRAVFFRLRGLFAGARNNAHQQQTQDQQTTKKLFHILDHQHKKCEFQILNAPKKRIQRYRRMRLEHPTINT